MAIFDYLDYLLTHVDIQQVVFQNIDRYHNDNLPKLQLSNPALLIFHPQSEYKIHQVYLSMAVQFDRM
mgnify:CR=1 FL=1